MRFVSVKSHDVRAGELQIDLIGEDRKRYPLVLTEPVALQLLLTIQQVARHLQPDQSPIRHELLYSVAACQPIAVDQARQGILVTTAEGFEIPLVMDQDGCSALRACIDQIERGIRHEGPVH